MSQHLKVYDELIDTFGLSSFEERKIYYWVMTLEIDLLRSFKVTKRLSFQVALANAKIFSSYYVRHVEVFKALTVGFERERITFKSYKDQTYKSKPRSHGPYRYVVVLDKIKGQMFLGTRKNCYAMGETSILDLTCFRS